MVSDKKTKKLLKKVSKSKNAEQKAQLVKILNEQFHQKYVTTGVLKLLNIRVYDKDLKYLMATTEGLPGLSNQLVDGLYQQAVSREGADRYKAIKTLWVSPEQKPLMSVLLPYGGLKLRGYIELITDPVFQFEKSAHLLGSPVMINSNSGNVLFKSEQ